jgi:predicted esterase
MNMSNEHFISSKRTFRYYTSGDLEKAHTIIYALHGYGQLSRYFIEKFKGLDENYFIVAPEGMHRFYLEGSAGRVGASWMTKEDRDHDIEDNIYWLDELDRVFEAKKPQLKKIILGFSQGGATAARWFYNGSIHAHHLIVWASVFPPDLPKETVIQYQSERTNFFVLGQQDQYYTEDKQRDLVAFYRSMGFDTTQYEGTHAIHSETLEAILRRLT